VQGAKIVEISIVSRELVVGMIFRIFNPSDKKMRFGGGSYTIFDGERKIADGRMERMLIGPHSSDFLLSPVRLPLLWFFSKSLLDLKDRGRVTLNIKGRAIVDDKEEEFTTEWMIGK
jgi:hypothetical protein